MKLAALLVSEADLALVPELRELGPIGAVVGGGDPRRLALAVQEEGLELLAVVGPGAEALAAELGAWVGLEPGAPSLARAATLSEVEDLLATPADRTLVQWSGEGGEDPGPAADEALGSLVRGLAAAGFDGCLAIRAGDAARLSSQLAEVRAALAEHASWWDGSEDGY